MTAVGMKRSTWAVVIIGNVLVINALVYVFSEIKETGRAYTVISDFLAIIASLVAATGLYSAFNNFRQWDFVKTSWLMLFSGMMLFCTGETIRAFMELGLKLNMAESFPTVADTLRTLGYFPLCVGALMLVRGYIKSGFSLGRPRFYVSLGLAWSVCAAALCYFLFLPILADTSMERAAKAIYIFHPAADLFLILNAMILVYVTGFFSSGMVSRPWKCVAFGFVFMTLADITYSYLNLMDKYTSNGFTDIGWNTGYLLIGLAGFYQKELFDLLQGKSKT